MSQDDQPVSFPVEFKNVGLGKEKARIGVSIARGDLELAEAHELFCNSQLAVTLKCDPNAKRDAEGQATLADTSLALEAVADASKYSVSADGFSVSLSMTKSAIDVARLGDFSAQSGRLFCERLGEAKATESDDGDDED